MPIAILKIISLTHFVERYVQGKKNERKFGSPTKRRAKSLMAAVFAVFYGYEHIHLFDEISEFSF